jgi:hypothetical protein
MTMKLARKFAGLFVKGARASQRMVVLLGEFLLKFAKQIRELAEIGYGAIVGFFEDTKLLVESIGEGALLYIDRAGTMLFSIPDKGLVLEGFGTLPGIPPRSVGAGSHATAGPRARRGAAGPQVH